MPYLKKEFDTIKHVLFSCKKPSIKVCYVDKPDRFGVLGTLSYSLLSYRGTVGW